MGYSEDEVDAELRALGMHVGNMSLWGKKKAIANHYYHIDNSPKARAKAEAKAKEAKAEAKPLDHAAKAREALAATKDKLDAAVAAAKA
ncbi:MAG: hypothetical protein ACKPKO_03190, partial [Candidatus Fonsibacter sp.]